MNVDSVITLDNDVKCLLLEKVEYNSNNYFLSVVLNEEEEPSEEYVVFQEIIEGNDKYVERVDDPTTLSELVKLFTSSLEKFVDGLPEEV